MPQTRRPLTAVFPEGRGTATVTLKGQNIHGDEHHYGPENGIGMFNEFTLDDFANVDNITFSSRNAGCAMIELDRYAPLLPEGEPHQQILLHQYKYLSLKHGWFLRQEDRPSFWFEGFYFLPRT